MTDIEKYRYWQWKIQIRPVTVIENRFFKRLKILFAQQERKVLKNLQRVEDQIPKSEKIVRKDKTDDLVDKIVFNLEEEIEIFKNGGRPFIEGSATVAGQRSMEGLVGGLDFDSTDPNFLKSVDDKTLKFAKDVNETTLAKLKPKVKDAIKEGGGVEPVRKAIQEVFDGTIRGTAFRSRLIARTEMVGSSTLGNLEAYRQSGVVAGKEWLTSRDAKVRDTHAAEDGVVVPIDETFSVGGATLAGPGVLVSGNEAEIMNCRCVTLPARLPS